MVKRAGGALIYSVKVNPQSTRSLATQIVNSIRELILSGGIYAGTRLPATRTMAAELGVSRTTMVEVFERLIAEGLVEARVGAGTFVKRIPGALAETATNCSTTIGGPGERTPSYRLIQSPPLPPIRSGPPKPSLPDFAPRLPHPKRAFTTALPALDEFPVARWARLLNKQFRVRNEVYLDYGNVGGFRPLRRMIASHLRATRGIVCDEGQVFIVNGAQQAFHIIGSTLLTPGDRVWFENPGAIGARNALLAAKAQLIPVSVDYEGIVVAEGHRIAPDFRMAFVTPTHQQPLGVTMSLARRFQLLAAAESADAWIIEDDYDGDFHFDSMALPAIKSADRAERVIYVGSFSKSLFPALRLGYFVLPETLVDTFTEIFNAYLPGSPVSLQATVAAFMEEGHFATHLRRMRRIYQERHDFLMNAAGRHFGARLTMQEAEAGLHTVGHLPPELSEDEVAQHADQRGVTVVPISRYCLGSAPLNGLVFGFGGFKPEEIELGSKVLGQVLNDLHRPQGVSASSSPSISTSV